MTVDVGPVSVTAREAVVDGLETSYLMAGSGDPVVLLHGGEFGASGRLGWERVIGLLAQRHTVIVPDLLGYGGTAKVHDFVDGRRRRIAHVAAFCAHLGLGATDFVGNSMGAVMLLHDLTASTPQLDVRRAGLICGGGTIQDNEHVTALYEYDGSFEAMRAIVRALFHDRAFAADEAYVLRRHESSLLPGAWEAVAAARFRRPEPSKEPAGPKPALALERVDVPVLVVEGGCDKLLPSGWSNELAEQLTDARAVTINEAGHCPQIEQPERTAAELLPFLDGDN